MADFQEKENIETVDEFSTVFSDPVEHKQVKVKNKKLLPKILAGALALLVLVGSTVAVIKLIPVKEEGEEQTETSNTIEVKKLKSDKISSVKVTNTNGTVDFYSETVEDKTSSSSETKVEWYTKQVDKTLTDSSSIENVVEKVATISANMEITKKSAEECGLTSASTKAVVTPNNADAYTVLLGDKSPDNTGYYLKIENEDKIYLVSDEVYNDLQFTILDFAATPTIEGFDKEDKEVADNFTDEGTMESFDRLVISGENYPEEISVLPNDDEQLSEYYSYIIKTPQLRLAQKLENITPFFESGITPSGVYSYDVTSATLKKVGLDKPDIQLKMQIGKATVTFKIKQQADGDYAVISEKSPVVYRVSASTLAEVAGYKTTDYYLSTVFLTNIDKLSNFTVNTAEKSYSFDIVKNEDEDAEEDYTITIDGKKLVADNFQNFYANCVSLTTKDYINDNLTSKPDVTFVMTLKKGGTSIIEFTKVSATRYQCKLDGIVMGRVTTSALSNLVKLAEKTANGETVEFN